MIQETCTGSILREKCDGLNINRNEPTLSKTEMQSIPIGKNELETAERETGQGNCS